MLEEEDGADRADLLLPLLQFDVGRELLREDEVTERLLLGLE